MADNFTNAPTGLGKAAKVLRAGEPATGAAIFNAEREAKKLWIEIEASKGEIKDTKILLTAALLVLIAMFATVLVMVWLDWKNSNERVLERLDALTASK